MASKKQAIIKFLSNNPDAKAKDAETALKPKIGKYSSALFYSAKREMKNGKGKAPTATAAKPSSNGQQSIRPSLLSSFKVVSAVEKAKALLQSVSKEEAKALIDAL
jgi:hypothetical protein